MTTEIQEIKLVLTFTSQAALAAFVMKMGDSVINATVTASSPVGAPAAAPKKKKGGAAATAEIPAVPAAAQELNNVAAFPGGGFPGAPTNFAPGAPGLGAPAAPAHVPVQPAIQPPSVAPAAPVAAAPAEPSAEHKQYIQGCQQVMQTLGQVNGLTDAHLQKIMTNVFAESGVPAGTGISAQSFAQIQAFYPVLYSHVKQVCEGTYTKWQ